MNRVKIAIFTLFSFILSVYVLSCAVEDSTEPKNCRQYDYTFGVYDIFREQYSENATPTSSCDTGPEAGTVSFDGDSLTIEYQNNDDQKVVVTYNVVSSGQ